MNLNIVINTYQLYRPKSLSHIGPSVATCTEIDLAGYEFRTTLEIFVTYFRTISQVSCITEIIRTVGPEWKR
jgi:hypothetical protein